MPATLAHLDPTQLVIAENIRTRVELSKSFIASIRERGVLEPVIAHRTDDDTVVVVAGQRRTLAAREAGIDQMPVLIHDTPPAATDRLVDQWVENEQRSQLTGSEKVAAVEQMTLEGLSVAQIAKRTGTTKTAVTAAVTAASSATAREAADQLTLEQAAALAEFDGDDETTSRLIKAATTGQFDHRLAQIKQAKALEAAEAELRAQLNAQGIRTIDSPAWNDNTTDRLDRLSTTEGNPITEEEHTDCPGRCAWTGITWTTRYTLDGTELTREEIDDIDDDTYEKLARHDEQIAYATHGCQNWAQHGHTHTHLSQQAKPRAADMTDEEREQAKKDRQHVIQSNKDWAACTDVRRAWLTTFATRKTPPKGAETYIAAATLRDDSRGWHALTTLGLDSPTLATEIDTATPKRALHITLMLHLAQWEDSTHKNTWRSRTDHDARTLTALQTWGYTLSDIEQRITDTQQ